MFKTTRSIFVSTLFILFILNCRRPEPRRDHLLLESSFEGSNPLEGWGNKQHCCEYSVAQNDEKFTDSSHSLRLEVRSTDPLISGSIRAELVQPVEEIGTERWYGFNMYLENWDFDNACEHVFQWHPDNSYGVATAALWISSGRYIFETNTSGGNEGNIYNDLGPVLNNQWVAWIIHVKWADDTSGLLQVWKNGLLMIDQRGIKTAPPEGTYFKLGINKFGWLNQRSSTTRRILYFDEVRIGDAGAGYDGVKPRY